MKMLDLFCGAGGAAMGYYRAGFSMIIGVDIRPQKNYPFLFVQNDALTVLKTYAGTVDFIHASPPCQAFTSLNRMWNSKKHPNLIDPIRQLLTETGKPWVIENVPGAPLRDPVILCGTMFGLRTESGSGELWRHRLFESNVKFRPPGPCVHRVECDRVIGVYGGHGRDRRRIVTVTGHSGGIRRRDGTQQFSVAESSEAMGIDWMTGSELSQAIPPSYTEWIGKQLTAMGVFKK